MRMRTALLMIPAILIAAAGLGSTAQTPTERDGSWFILVQSELDYFEAGERRIDVEMRQALLSKILETVGTKARITIAVQGELPKNRRFDLRFRDKTVKEVLTWLAKHAGLAYRVEGPEKIVAVAPKSG